ncbi:MAG: ribosome maturation factor RimM [Lachnospiraceae bacterium]|jgi:16S rRNA processing protein RimM|nr:ribosome maturation factor RimM [Lachnospiraceae bacterium]MCI1657239.1 ribosome maturation factor RimM [Lachnospiraceae bacterium]MCI2195725.1 ribosome maturation factor RimM [Lachnospiraceae bacterium]HAD20439.1 16S rRNA processing protein RimM [Lachnospiraceae bacterium]
MTDLFQVGIITNTHGIAGEVKVFPTTDDPKRFKKLKEVILEPEKENRILHITGVKFVKNLVVLKFQEFASINDVQRLREKKLYVTRENAVKLKKNEYFIADLIGLKVQSTDGRDLGTLTDVITTGANDVYVLQGDGRELLVPAIRECIRAVDLEAGTMTVYLLPGLEDL